MIRAVIFDLDNCLSAADEPGKEFLEPVFDAIRRANQGRFSDQALADSFSDCWRHPLDFVAENTDSLRTCSQLAGRCPPGWKWQCRCAAIPTSARWQNSRCNASW